jgi:flavin reductase (DIM6/NTAB) family NADH-FMN oxidoreductase RutF
MSPAKVVALADFDVRAGGITGGLFRSVMRELASGVVLVTSAFEGNRAGCAVSSVSSLSLEPASLIVCLNANSSTLRSIRAGGAFAVNVLADRHHSLAQRFASTSMRGEDRFAEGDWDSTRGGPPRLRDALAVVDCRLERIVEHSTHAIIIGSCVAAAKGQAGPALVHWRSRFETLG